MSSTSVQPAQDGGSRLMLTEAGVEGGIKKSPGGRTCLEDARTDE